MAFTMIIFHTLIQCKWNRRCICCERYLYLLIVLWKISNFFLFYLISFDDFKNSAQRFFPVVGVVIVKQMFFFSFNILNQYHINRSRASYVHSRIQRYWMFQVETVKRKKTHECVDLKNWMGNWFFHELLVVRLLVYCAWLHKTADEASTMVFIQFSLSLFFLRLAFSFTLSLSASR